MISSEMKQDMFWEIRGAIEPYLDRFVDLDLNVPDDNVSMDLFALDIRDAVVSLLEGRQEEYID